MNQANASEGVMTRPADADDGRAVYWPYPGQAMKELPEPPTLRPPKYSVGDRVESRWGDATVIRVLESAGIDGTREYVISHDWSGVDPPFGHQFEEDDLQPGRPRPAPEPDEPRVQTAQLEMF